MALPSKDALSGILFVAIGAATAIGASGYRMGTLSAMGPGFFPFWLGALLAGFGAVVVLGAGAAGLRGEVPAAERPERWNVKGLILVLAGIVLFGLLLEPLGLVVAIAALVGIASLASRELSPLAISLNALVLALLAVLLFHVGLGLPIAVLPAFLAG